jgi:hypothetical protein
MGQTLNQPWPASDLVRVAMGVLTELGVVVTVSLVLNAPAA